MIEMKNKKLAEINERKGDSVEMSKISVSVNTFDAAIYSDQPI